MTRPFPPVKDIREAVKEVIKSNKNDGLRPQRFSNITANGDIPDLKLVCERLIENDEILEELEKGFKQCNSMLILEDFVAVHGQSWGFKESTLIKAKARVHYFNHLAGFPRY